MGSYKLIVCKLQTKNYLKLTNTFTNTQNKWFINLSFKLKTGNFTYLKIESSKSFKLENLKLLGLILEIFCEPLFLSTSHGFRPFKGCHSALKQIQLFWTDVSWITSYKFKIQQTINFTVLFKLMSRKINDKLLFTLLKKKFKNNTCNFKDLKILTPILINIYLHYLDLELEKLKKNYNFFFKKLFYFNFNLKTLRKASFRTLNLVKYGRILTHKTFYCPFKTKMKNQNSNFKPFKIRYIRYLNFFLIGVIGDYKKNYQKINRYTLTFCNSNLKLLLAYKNSMKVNSKIVINFLNFKINFLKFKKFFSYSKKSFKKYSDKKKVTFKILKQKNLLLTTFSNCFFNLKKKQLKRKKSI